jgi:DNA (cytosine-5)-methyltransferase 1
MNVLDLFSGIGGFSLGLERAGMRTVAFCEIEPYARSVLAKHWPDVPCYDDVRGLTAERLAADGIAADVICGGFPCQDISVVGKNGGINAERSGLWSEYARIVGEVRPRFIIVENVAALLGRGIDRVLGDLAALGYDAEWHCIPASYVGAAHRRDRVWIVANPDCGDAQRGSRERSRLWTEKISERADDNPGRPSKGLADADSIATFGAAISRQERNSWEPEPDVGRVANGVPSRVDRLKGLGNAVVPQIPEIIGRAIMNSLTLSSQERP